MAGVIVLDASVLVAHLDADDAQHERASRLLLDTVDEPLGASPAPGRASGEEDATVGQPQPHVATFDDRLHRAAAELGLARRD